MDKGMYKLFEATEINGMKLPNRFVRSATWEGMAAEDGACKPELVELMAQLAQGGVGLIITSHAYVRPHGQAGPWQLGIYKDELIESLKEMVQAVHKYGASIALQISHGGFFASAKLIGQPPLAPSQVKGFAKSPRREMIRSDVHDIVNAFGQAAYRAKEAGFDGLQIHAAHGYLLNQFLSPAFNRRTDEYGGSVENRARFLLEVLREVRAAVGSKFPVMVKLNSRDYLDGGLTLDDSLQVGSMLQEGGIDAIELSGGTVIPGKESPSWRGILSEEKEAYFRDAAKAFKEKLQVPLLLVGGIRSFHLAEQIIEKGYADYISMSRPFIREPTLVNRWESGDLRKATCLSDSKCWRPLLAGEGIRCVVEEELKGKK
jgi:2,4-dienoyl-CoA reductase-like NADH-dependent reductase (Old Yellow Enzyme family)